MLNNSPHRILIYHGIDTAGRKDLNLRFISATQLEEQLICFKKHYNIVSLSDYFEQTKKNISNQNPQNKLDSKPLMAITFDDGYLNNFNIALKILEKHQIKATFFITGIRSQAQNHHWPDALDICVRYNWRPLRFQGAWFFKMGRDYRSLRMVRLKQLLTNAQPKDIKAVLSKFQHSFEQITNERPNLDLYWQLMDENDLQNAAKSLLIEIGVHGLHHYNLAALSSVDAEKELLTTKIFLEKVIGKKINAVAWPFGLYTQSIAEFANSIGLDRQYAVDFLFPADADNPNMRERMGVHPFLEHKKLLEAINKGNY
jgi:peptidoglycan/xylan/chitin deacetylase (PgdA/CDA1 family)